MSGLSPAPEGYPIKLVRDRTPAILNSSKEPGELWYEVAPIKDVERLLRLKLSEEVGEYLVDGGIDELADVIAVIEALAQSHGWTLEELIIQARGDERGGFLHGVLMLGRHSEFDLADDAHVERS